MARKMLKNANKKLDSLKDTDHFLAYAIVNIDGGCKDLATNAVFESYEMASEVLTELPDAPIEDLTIIPLYYVYKPDWADESEE